MYLTTYFQKAGNDRFSNIRHTNSDQIEIIQTLCSDGSVIVGEHTLPMRYGAVYVFDSSIPHCTAPNVLSHYVRSVVIIERTAFNNFINATGTKSILHNLYDIGVCAFYPKPRDTNELQSWFSRIDQLRSSGSDEADIFLCLLQLIIKLRDCSDFSHERQTKKNIVARAAEYLDRKMAHCAGTSEVAEALHVNKSHLCRVFKEATGMTITEYLTEKRLTAADKLLANRSLSILEISVQAGFSSESYFIDRYKKKYGISPGKKRQMTDLSE